MGKYDFDRIIDRKNTSCLKYDFGMKRKGRTDLLPMWVADMDFRTEPAIAEAIAARAQHAIYGYTENSAEEKRASIFFALVGLEVVRIRSMRRSMEMARR